MATICHQHGLDRAIISPGSRNAPLTLAFTRHPSITSRSISDERSAAFIGLGIAQERRKATILCCTSGSAAYNYAPAVAEAYFRHVPLVIFTADRPPEWIDQLDGQTIRQADLYGRHVKKSYTIPVDLSESVAETHAYRLVNEAIAFAHEYPQGPVHINVPFREPFYPTKNTALSYDLGIKTFDVLTPNAPELNWNELSKVLQKFNKKLIFGGQYTLDLKLNNGLENIFKTLKIPVLGDVISNLHGIDEVISHSDIFIGSDKHGLKESLQPDLLITFGLSTISKNLKLLLRQYPPKEHWHIQPAGEVADTFNSLTRIIRCDPQQFFSELTEQTFDEDFNAQKQENYCNIWLIEERKSRRLITEFLKNAELNELSIVHHTLKHLPVLSNIHLANSMAVRYANLIGLKEYQSGPEVFANRGTSGIDGCTSTAVGSCFETDKLTLLITGDVAFFYDRNSFWHNYNIGNLRILLLNNHGGGIFRMINGPKELPELEEYFETRQPLTAQKLAEEFDMDYLLCDKKSKIKNYIQQFFEMDGRPKILEVISNAADNAQFLTNFRKAYNKQQ